MIGKKVFYRDGNGLLLKQVEFVYRGTVFQREVTTLWKYDSNNRPLKCIEAAGTPEQKITSIKYNRCGQKEKIIKPDGVIIYHHYDEHGRLKDFHALDHSFDYSYQYDLNNNLLSVEDHIQETINQRIYDENNRLRFEKLGNGLSLHYDYDNIGRITQISYPDQTAVSYHYQGILLSHIIRLGKENQPLYQHTYQKYDLSQNVLRAQIIGQGGILHHQYDALNRTVKTLSESWVEKDLSYDQEGNLKSKHIEDSLGEQTFSYTYDIFNQLLTENEHQYSYDSIHNRI